MPRAAAAVGELDHDDPVRRLPLERVDRAAAHDEAPAVALDQHAVRGAVVLQGWASRSSARTSAITYAGMLQRGMSGGSRRRLLYSGP